MINEFIDKVIAADAIIANGIFYWIDLVNTDSQVMEGITLDNKTCIIDLGMLARSDSVALYTMEPFVMRKLATPMYKIYVDMFMDTIFSEHPTSAFVALYIRKKPGTKVSTAEMKWKIINAAYEAFELK